MKSTNKANEVPNTSMNARGSFRLKYFIFETKRKTTVHSFYFSCLFGTDVTYFLKRHAYFEILFYVVNNPSHVGSLYI